MVISGQKGIKAIASDFANKKLLKIVYLRENKTELIDLCKSQQIPYEIKDKQFFDKHYGDKQKYKYKDAIAIIKNKKEINLRELIQKQGDKSLLIILDHLQDPFNFGAILRTCVAGGVNGVIIPKNNHSPLNHYATLKASQGYALNIDIVRVANLHQTIVELKKNNYWIYATDISEKSQSFKEIEYANRSVLLLGAEGDGVSPILKKISDHSIYIPMKKGIDSLNVSVAAGILIFEILKPNF